MVATESSVTSESEALKLRIKQLENKLAQLGKQQQTTSEQQGSQGRQLEQLRGELKSQQGSAAQLAAALKEQQGSVAGLDGRLQSLAGEQAALKAAQGEVAKLESRLQDLASEVAALKKQGDPNQAISRLESDLLVLRSQLDNRPANTGTAELDAFRAQMTRNITTLQAQVRNLQGQLNAR
ncbi:Chromosome partition protein Smc [compost metagenome]